MLYKITTNKDSSKGHGYCKLPFNFSEAITTVTIYTYSTDKNKTTWRENFELPFGCDHLDIELHGHIKSFFVVEFYTDRFSVPLSIYTGRMRDLSPSNLYDMVEKLIDDHKRINPSMLQSRDG